MYQKQTYLLVFLLIIAPICYSHAVCDLATLQMELRQDLADNGMLDCLRVIDPPHFVDETEQQKNLRLSAQWDTSCSFESDYNWMEDISKNFGINQLVDSIGDPVKKNFPDQADMCEIVRAALAKGKIKIKDLNLQNIPSERLINQIDCVGTTDKRGTRICAATGVSFHQKDSWTIFLTSSAIKFGNRPKFVKSIPKHASINKNNSSTDNLLKALLKLGKKNLMNNESKVAKMIDKEVSQEQEPELQKGKSTVAHVHVKRSIKSNIIQKRGFSPLEGGSFSYKLDKSRLIFSFYMLSFKLMKPGTIFTKFSFNGREVPESRQSLGLVLEGSVTSAFAQVYNPVDKKAQLGILYKSSTEGKIDTSSYNHNLSYGSITLPVGSVFKHVNARILEFIKTESWILLKNFQLEVNAPKEAYYLIFYNFSIKLKGKGTLYTRLLLNTKMLRESSSAIGAIESIGGHSARVMKLSGGKHNINIEYKYEGSAFSLTDFTNPKYIQSLTAFELPQGTIVKNFNLDRSILLFSSGQFRSFGFNAKVNLTKRKTVLVIFNVNLKTNGTYFAIRVRMGRKYNRKSVISMKNLAYGRGLGYVVRVLTEGSYTFDLDYKTDSKESYNPDTSDSQNVSMQIIEMD